MIKSYEKDFLISLLERMMLVRKFEEKLQALFLDGKLHGTTHLGIGEEASSVGATFALKTQDYLFATHRGHGQVIAKGTDVKKIMAEMFGKRTGVSSGLGGSMHLVDVQKGVLGTNGIVGANLPLACGTALSIKMKGEKDKVATVFFGDGASNEGVIHESMNIASIWNLPVIFILVNNGYSVSKKLFEVTKNTDLANRATMYGFSGYDVDGNNVLEVYETVKKAREDVLAGKGPVLIVANTYRISGHSKSDNNFYRDEGEIAKEKVKDPITAFIGLLKGENLVFDDEIAFLENKVNSLIDEAVDFAIKAPEPTIDDVIKRVYAE
ncbi:MAG: thiamine pyrophosphate-dependent dehydrogenase E1 component subunit alpha [Clostridiales bacterium]|nr:thiamine pyrophosphate-dependent dehydrogenase E1 component subunit alpha [Clostridiales bacterium]